MARIKISLILLILAIFSVACAGGSGGSVIGSRQSCQIVNRNGSCQGGFSRLRGTFTHQIEVTAYRRGDAVQVEGTFSTQSGVLIVRITAPDGTVTTTEITPQSSGTVSGLATADSSFDDIYIPIVVEAVDGEAQDIEFSIEFWQP